MSNPKANKRVFNTNDSFLGNKKQLQEPVYEYRFEEIETTALESVYTYLFEKLTGINQDKSL